MCSLAFSLDDCSALEPSVENKTELNVIMVKMRKLVKGAKVSVFRQLTRYVLKLSTNKTEKDKVKGRIQRKIEGRKEELKALLKFDINRLSKAILSNEMKIDKCDGNTDSMQRLVIRISSLRKVSQFVDKFREDHSDWRDLAHYLLYKDTAGKFKKPEQKRRAGQRSGELPLPGNVSKKEAKLMLKKAKALSKDCGTKQRSDENKQEDNQNTSVRDDIGKSSILEKKAEILDNVKKSIKANLQKRRLPFNIGSNEESCKDEKGDSEMDEGLYKDRDSALDGSRKKRLPLDVESDDEEEDAEGSSGEEEEGSEDSESIDTSKKSKTGKNANRKQRLPLDVDSSESNSESDEDKTISGKNFFKNSQKASDSEIDEVSQSDSDEDALGEDDSNVKAQSKEFGSGFNQQINRGRGYDRGRGGSFRGRGFSADKGRGSSGDRGRGFSSGRNGGFGDRGNGDRGRGFSSGRGRGFRDSGDGGRGFSSGRGRGFGDSGSGDGGRGFSSGRGRGFGDRGRGFSGDRGRGRGFGDRGSGDRARGRGFGGRGNGDRGRGFSGDRGRGRGFSGDGGRGRGFSGDGGRGRGFGDRNRGSEKFQSEKVHPSWQARKEQRVKLNISVNDANSSKRIKFSDD